MPIYRCPRCGYSSHIKTYLRKHFLRKRPCSQLTDILSIEQCFMEVLGELPPSESKMNPNESKSNKNESKMNPIESKMNPKVINSNFKAHQCEFCDKIYSTNSNLHKHLKKCKLRKKTENLDLQKDLIIRELIRDKQKMQEQHSKDIEQLLTKVGNVTNIQNNVYINSHGNENLSYITSNYLSNLLKIPYGAVPKLLKNIHFHPEHPENRNIKITNKKLPYISVYKDDHWELKDKNEIIENLVDKSFNILDMQYEKDKNILNESQLERYKIFQNKFEEKDRKLKKQLKREVGLTILNYE